MITLYINLMIFFLILASKIQNQFLSKSKNSNKEWRDRIKVKDPDRFEQYKASWRMKAREYYHRPRTEQELWERREKARLRKQKQRAREAERKKLLGILDSDALVTTKHGQNSKAHRFTKVANIKDREMLQWHRHRERVRDHYLKQQANNGG